MVGLSFSHLLPETQSDSPPCVGSPQTWAEVDAGPCGYFELIARREEAEAEAAVQRRFSRCLRYCAPELSRSLLLPQCGTACAVDSDSTAPAGLDERGDVYSFALVVWELFAGEPPLAQHPDPAAAAAAAGGARPPLAAVRWATGLAGLLERAWASDPAKRCTADDAVAALHRLSSAVEQGSGCVAACALA